jgi:hypothetical protein
MLVISDIHNELFKQFSGTTAVQQYYVDFAISEVKDWAVRHDLDPDAIPDPWHTKILRYSIKIALKEFADDRAGFNHESRYQESDVYTQLWRRMNRGAQIALSDLTEVMFSGETQTKLNRSVNSVELVRGG